MSTLRRYKLDAQMGSLIEAEDGDLVYYDEVEPISERVAAVEQELRETAGELEQTRARLAGATLTERIAAAYGAGQSAAKSALAAVREHVDRLGKLRRMRSWDSGEVYAASQVDDIASELHDLLAKGGGS